MTSRARRSAARIREYGGPMHLTHPNLFERYSPLRRRAELGFWVGVLLLQVLFSIAVAAIDVHVGGRTAAFWQVLSWELSSQLTLLALVPAVMAFERRLPLADGGWRRHWPWHLAG